MDMLKELTMMSVSIIKRSKWVETYNILTKLRMMLLIDMLKELTMMSAATINRSKGIETYNISTKLRMTLFTTINRNIF
jgi:hypothetical protein